MNRTLWTAIFAVMFWMLSGVLAYGAVPNDVNGDGGVDVADVQCVALAVLGPQPPGCLAKPAAADLNCDDSTDVVDYQLIVLVVLKFPAAGMPPDKDANGDNIHDDCGGGVDPFCGDGECDPDETCISCEEDCGVCIDVGVGDIIITEIMKDPRAITDEKGEWFELRNMTTSPVSLHGWTIEDADGQSHKISSTPALTIGASALVVLGNNGNPATACGVDVDYAYSNFSLDNDGVDGIMLVAPDGTVVDEVFYDDDTFPDVPGYSLMLHPGKMKSTWNDDGANWCLGPLALDCEDWGTPNIYNPFCQPLPNCGDGSQQFGETCDDSNTVPGDGCDEKCQNENLAWCGNADVEYGETCDDGNTEAGDGCSPACQFEGVSVCGDGKKENAEECDDGNTKSGDGCDANCKLEEGCGDGIIQQDAGEQCDPPNPPDCSAECQLSYTDPLCGDGYKHEDEECDDGCLMGQAYVCEQVVDDNDGCSWECKLEGTCGDGILDEAKEECDDGNNLPGDGCDPFCFGENLVPACEPSPCCGDWQLNPGEGCDDGNLVDGDGCDGDCAIEQPPVCTPSPCCGDGSVDDGESCDDGNLEDDDGCSGTCLMESVCGNGEPEGDEECDDGNLDPGDGCDGGCQWESTCGDGKVEAPETCDDGNTIGGDGCSAECNEEGGGTGTVTGTITYPGGAVGATNNLYINFLTGNPPNVEPGWVWQKMVVKSFPYTYTLEEAPAGTFEAIASFDKDGNGVEGENSQPPEPPDALGVHFAFTNPKKFTVVEGQTTAGVDIKLEVPLPPPN